MTSCAKALGAKASAKVATATAEPQVIFHETPPFWASHLGANSGHKFSYRARNPGRGHKYVEKAALIGLLLRSRPMMPPAIAEDRAPLRSNAKGPRR